jgi:hypothetical protein
VIDASSTAASAIGSGEGERRALLADAELQQLFAARRVDRIRSAFGDRPWAVVAKGECSTE